MTANAATAKLSATIAAVWLAVFAILQLTPIDDADVFTQIRLGQLALEQGLTTWQDCTLAGARTRAPNVGWLAQLVLAALYDLAGWQGVQVLRASLYASAIALGLCVPLSRVLEYQRTLRHPLALSFAGSLGFLAALSNATVRPQALAALFFCCVYLLLSAREKPLWHWPALLAVAIVWQNCHPSLAMAVLLALAMAAGDLARWPLGLASWRSCWRDARAPLLAALVLAALQMATPLGAQIFLISARNYEISRELIGVSEWLPPWRPEVRDSMLGYWIALAASAGLLATGWRRLDRRELSVAAAFGLLSLLSSRFALFWALAMLPVWRSLFGGLPFFRESQLNGMLPRTRVLAAAAALSIASIAGAAVLVDPLLESRAPVAGVRKLAEQLPEGVIYNYREWGGPLALLGSPKWQVSYDGRLYLFSPDEWREYARAARGELELNEILNRHDPKAFFLHPGFHAGLVAQLEREIGWKRLYGDEMCVIYTR